MRIKFIILCPQAPEQMKKPCPDQDRGEIGDNPGCISVKLCYVPKDDLSHLVERADIEHIDSSAGMEDQVKECGEQAAG